MWITLESLVTGEENSMELDMTVEQYYEWQSYEPVRRKVQEIFPNLTATERDFLITGMSPEEQEKFYSE